MDVKTIKGSIYGNRTQVVSYLNNATFASVNSLMGSLGVSASAVISLAINALMVDYTLLLIDGSDGDVVALIERQKKQMSALCEDEVEDGER